jgi:hypothetical protein
LNFEAKIRSRGLNLGSQAIQKMSFTRILFLILLGLKCDSLCHNLSLITMPLKMELKSLSYSTNRARSSGVGIRQESA